MKKLIICLTVASVAALTSLQAGEQCAAKTEKAACSQQVSKTSCPADVKAACSQQVSKTSSAVEGKAACSQQVSKTSCSAEVKAACSQQVKAEASGCCAVKTASVSKCSAAEKVAKRSVPAKGATRLVQK
jgi:hypothetical protein